MFHRSTAGRAIGCPTGHTYDSQGDARTTTQPNGSVVTTAYDLAGELCWTYQGPSSNGRSSPPSGATTYTYDANGDRLTETVSNASTVLTHTYDAKGRLCWTYAGTVSSPSCTSPPSGSTVYTYDSDGNPASVIYPQGGVVVSQAYNSHSQPCWTYVSSAVSTNACSSPPSGATTYTYDANGNLLSEVLPNGGTNSWTYDASNAIASVDDTKGTATIFAATYTRNSAELITQDSSQPSSNQSYVYTDQNQVCNAGSTGNTCTTGSPAYTYAYDSAGNLTTNKGSAQAYNTKNELCWTYAGASSNGCASPPAGATMYSYNSNGDRTGVSSGESYQYNSLDQLCWAYAGSSSNGCASPPSGATTYAYYGDGLRASKAVAGTTTTYTWDDASSIPPLLQETTGTSTTSYVYGPNGSPLEEILPSGAMYYYSCEALGSTRVLTDSSGSVQDTDTYDPYGNLTASTGTVQNHLLYASQYLDSETGFYYLRARYYDPATGQFLMVDPAETGYFSAYGYASNNPIDNTDPTGASTIHGDCETVSFRRTTGHSFQVQLYSTCGRIWWIVWAVVGFWNVLPFVTSTAEGFIYGSSTLSVSLTVSSESDPIRTIWNALCL